MKFGSTTVSFDDLINAFESIVPEADQELSDKGITLDLDPPELPRGLENFLGNMKHGVPQIQDVTTLTSSQVAQFMTYYTGMANYTETLAGEYKTALTIAERQKSIIESSLKVHYHDVEKKKATLCVDYVRTTPEYQNAERACLLLKVKSKKAEMKMNTSRRLFRLTSREQSRRGEVMNLEGIEDNIDASQRWKNLPG